MALRLCTSFSHPLIAPSVSVRTTRQIRRCSIRSCTLEPNESRKLVLEVKEKLETEYPGLPVGRNGRDDEDLILWFLRDRRFSVEEAVSKLTKAIKWRQAFGVSELSEEAVKATAETGKAYVHDFPDVDGRPVLMVVGSKHVPLEFDPSDDRKLCVFLMEKALSRLPTGKEQMLGIVDLRGFRTENADLKFLTFLVRFSNQLLKMLLTSSLYCRIQYMPVIHALAFPSLLKASWLASFHLKQSKLFNIHHMPKRCLCLSNCHQC